jgi:cytochrome c553
MVRRLPCLRAGLLYPGVLSLACVLLPSCAASPPPQPKAVVASGEPLTDALRQTYAAGTPRQPAKDQGSQPLPPQATPPPTETAPAETAPPAQTCTVDPVTHGTQDDRLPPGLPTTRPFKPSGYGLDTSHEGHAIQYADGKLLVVDPVEARLLIVDAPTLAVVTTVPLASRATRVALKGTTAWLTLREAGLLVSIDLAKPELVGSSWAVGREPEGLVVVPVDPYAYVFAANPTVFVVALAGEQAIVGLGKTGTELWRAALPGRPHALACTPATSQLPAQVYATLESGPPQRIVLPPAEEGVHLTVASQPLSLRGLNPAHAYSTVLGVPLKPWDSSWARGVTTLGGQGYVSHLLAVTGDAQTLQVALDKGVDPAEVLATSSVPYYGPQALVLDPCKTVPIRPLEVSVSAYDQGVLRATEAVPPVLDAATGRNFLADFDQPVDLRAGVGADLLYAVAHGSDAVLVLNPAAGDSMRSPVARLETGPGPLAIAFAAQDKLAFVLDGDGHTLSRYDLTPLLDTSTSYPSYQSMDAPLVLQPTATAMLSTDPLPAQVQLGRRLFSHAGEAKTSAHGRLACASCHVEGMSDGLTWIIDKTLRQVPALAGRLADTEPYGWEGQFATLDLKIQDSTAHMGGLGLDVAEREALSAWLLVMPVPGSAPAPALSAQAQAGKVLFESPTVGCAGCHGGDGMVDGGAHDVGTATALEVKAEPTLALDTPSLRHLGRTAPYLHDGSAATLLQALEKTSGTMGHVEGLSTVQRAQLVAYLATL